MDEYFLGQIVMMAFERQMRNFMPCNGQMLQIRNYNALFALIGTQYGGDGVQTFALPDLRGVFPYGGDYAGIALGQRYPVNYQAGNSQAVVTGTIAQSNLPSTQAQVVTQATTVPLRIKATTERGTEVPADNSVLAAGGSGGTAAAIYASAPLNPTAPLVNLDGGSLTIPGNTSTVTIQGAGTPVKMPIPSLVVGFQICVMGIFPSLE